MVEVIGQKSSRDRFILLIHNDASVIGLDTKDNVAEYDSLNANQDADEVEEEVPHAEGIS